MGSDCCPNCGEELSATTNAFRERVPPRFRPEAGETIYNCGTFYSGGGCGRMWVEQKNRELRLFELIKQSWLQAQAQELQTMDKRTMVAWAQKQLPDLAPEHVRFCVSRTKFSPPRQRTGRAKAQSPDQRTLFE